MTPYLFTDTKSPFKIIWMPWLLFGSIIALRSIMNYLSKKVILADDSIRIISGILKRSIIEIPYAKIQSVELKKHIGFYDSIIIDDKIEEFGLKDTKKLSEYLNSKINKTLANTTITDKNPVSVNVVNSNSNEIDALSRLADLRTKGLITEEEFKKEKSKII